MSVTKFKKYKNRKIYSVTDSRYVTLSEVYQASLNGLVDDISVTDAVTGADITAETVIRGAIESLTETGLKSLMGTAMYVGREFGTKDKTAETKVTNVPPRLTTEEVNDLFSGKES